MSDAKKCPKCGLNLMDAVAVDIRLLSHRATRFAGPDPQTVCAGTDSFPCVVRQLAQAEERVGELEADLETMTRTAANQGDLLDQAQAEVGMLKMGFEPAPTADAYEAVCEARTKWQERAEKAKAENMRLRAIVDRLPKTVDGMPIVPGMTVFIPHPRPSNLITEREVLAPYGTLACLTKEPAHSGCCESTAHRLARECYSTREAALAAKEASDA